MKTSEIVTTYRRNYPFFTRDLLYSLVKRKLLFYKKLNGARDFPPGEIRKLEALLEKYAQRRRLEPARGAEVPAESLAESPVYARADVQLVDPTSPWGDQDGRLVSVSREGLTKRTEVDLEKYRSLKAAGLLAQLHEKLGRALFEKRSYRGVGRCLTEEVRTLLDADICDLLLPNPHSPYEVLLEERAFARTREDAGNPTTGVAESEWPSSAFEFNLTSAKLISRHSYDELRRLSSGNARPFSLLRIGITDRKGRLLARLYVENKRAPGGVAGPDVQFLPEDEEIAEALAETLPPVLEDWFLLRAITGIVQSVRLAENRAKVLDEVLWAGMRLTGADRGDIALYNPVLRQLIIEAERGDNSLVIGKSLPTQSVMFRLWNQNSDEKAVRIDDVSQCTDYYKANSCTRSELAARMEHGVLNLESFAFAGFDERDRDIVQDLAATASVAVRLTTNRGSAPVTATTWSEDGAGEWFRRLRPRLVSVLKADEAGILYVCDDARRLLRIAATVKCEKRGIFPDDFAYYYPENALATKVRREGQHYISGDPLHDPYVHHEVAKQFGIEGPVLGLPLLDGMEVVAVLVVWVPGRKAVQKGIADRELDPRLRELQVITPFLAQNIANEKRDDARDRMNRVLERANRTAQSRAGLAVKLQLVVEALRAWGFERVRLFRVVAEPPRFVGWLSSGMNHPELFEGLEIELDSNPFAKDTYETARANPSARKYDQVQIKDPHASRLEKNHEMSWAIVPLVYQDEVLGQIAVDAARSGREITGLDLEYLTRVGVLTSLIVGPELRVGNLSASHASGKALQRGVNAAPGE